MTKVTTLRKALLVYLIAAVAAVSAQAQQLTLDECKAMARDNYPAVKQYGLIEQSRDYTVSNASKGWLPQVSVSAGAYAFADVIDMSDQLEAAMGGMKNELYTASLMVNQTIYDGGKIAAGKRTAKAQAEVSREQLNVTLYDINSRVEQLYFGILTIDERLAQNKLLQHDLELSHNTVAAMLNGGLATPSDVDAVSVEQVKALQQEEGLKASREAYLLMLGTFIGQTLGSNTALERPAMPDTSTRLNLRPELSYYDAQNSLLDARRSALNADLMPHIGLFGVAALHNKVMSMMKDNLLAVGVTLSWNIGALYTRKNDIRSIEVNRQINESQRETFLFNTELQNRNSDGVINSLRRQIALDEKIINLRQSILTTSEKKVQNGTETVNEMLRNVNAVSEARQTKALHELQLLQEAYNLKNINNN